MKNNLKARMRELKKSRTDAGKRALIPVLREYLAANKLDTAAWYDLACCYDSLGRENEAEPCYAQVYKGWRGLPEKEQAGFFVGYGSTLRNNNKLARSAAVLREGVKRFPDYPALKLFLALTLYTSKNYRSSAGTLFGACLGMPAGVWDGYDRAINYYVKTLK